MINTTKNPNNQERKPIKTILNMQSFHLKIINNNKKPYFEETLTENKDNP